MFVVIAYDIADDRRRTAVFRLLKGYGQHVQESVFECDVTPRHYAVLRRALARRLSDRADSVRYYALCQRCVGTVEVANSPEVATAPPLYLI